MNKPDFEKYRQIVLDEDTDKFEMGLSFLDLIEEAKDYIEYLEGIHAPPYDKNVCACPQGSLCEFFNIEDEACGYGKI